MDNENFIIITTYVASGITNEEFINQRIQILKLSTIPSILQQNIKNFMWCIYLDEMNNPSHKLKELEDMLKKYSDKINIHIVKYKPILQDGSLCIDNRGRSCSTKRYELYLSTIKHCKDSGYLDNIKYITHLMLDDDDPILNNYTEWINNKVSEHKDKLDESDGVIVINKCQYIFYLLQIQLISIISHKAMKGSGFIFYKKEQMEDIRFHPYSIEENVNSNFAYKKKYNIGCVAVQDPPTWVYFRHKLSTTKYSKDFIVSSVVDSWQGINKIVEIMNFYNSNNLKILKNSMHDEKKSSEIINWVKFRKLKKKKILFIFNDIKKYHNAAKFPHFLKNNFVVFTIFLDENVNISKNNYLLKNSSNQILTSKNRVTKEFTNELLAFNPDFIVIFGDRIKMTRLKYYLKKKSYLCSIVDFKEKSHEFFGKNIGHVSRWRVQHYIILYKLLHQNLMGYYDSSTIKKANNSKIKTNKIKTKTNNKNTQKQDIKNNKAKIKTTNINRIIHIRRTKSNKTYSTSRFMRVNVI